jgi:hypothetical protein
VHNRTTSLSKKCGRGLPVVFCVRLHFRSELLPLSRSLSLAPRLLTSTVANLSTVLVADGAQVDEEVGILKANFEKQQVCWLA